MGVHYPGEPGLPSAGRTTDGAADVDIFTVSDDPAARGRQLLAAIAAITSLLALLVVLYLTM